MADWLADTYYGQAQLPGTFAEAADVPYGAIFDAFAMSPGVRSGAFNTPISTLPNGVGSMGKQDFLYDFYFRIWLIPMGQIDLGGISSEQHIDVSVWSAFPDRPMTLEDVLASGMEGVTLITPGDPPLVFGPLEEKGYTVIVSEDGPPDVNALMTWVFTGELPVSLNVLGARVRTWVLPPNWKNPPQDRYEWLTDIMESRGAFEQRVQLRQDPRRNIEASFLVTGDDLGWFDAQLFSWGARNWLIPVWYDKSNLTRTSMAGEERIYCDVSDREFSVGSYVLIGDDLKSAVAANVAEIFEDGLSLARPLGRTVQIGQAIWPARLVRVKSPVQQTQHTDRVVEKRVTFEVTDQPEIDPLPSSTIYKEFQVLTRAHNWIDAITRSYERKLNILDNTTGGTTWIDMSNWAQITREYKLMLRSRADRRAFVRWLSSVSGRLVPFWREDQERIMRMSPRQDVGETALLRILPIGYPAMLFGQPGRTALALRSYDGNVYYRTVIAAATDPTSGDEMLTLDATIPPSVPEDWRQISYLELVRLSSDAIEIAHESDQVAQVSLSLKGVKQ